MAGQASSFPGNQSSGATGSSRPFGSYGLRTLVGRCGTSSAASGGRSAGRTNGFPVAGQTKALPGAHWSGRTTIVSPSGAYGERTVPGAEASAMAANGGRRAGNLISRPLAGQRTRAPATQEDGGTGVAPPPAT